MHNRFLVYLVFALACIRMAVARVWSFAGSGETAPTAAGKSVVRQALRLRVRSQNRATQIKRHYAIELAGTFPQIRLASLASRPVPVPLENAALSAASAGSFDLQLVTGSNMLQSAGAQQPATDLLSSCTSCVSCGTCASCSTCSTCSTCSSCTCSCSSCGGCSTCSSCSCVSCGGCTSCFY